MSRPGPSCVLARPLVARARAVGQFVVTEVCVEIFRCVKTNILSLSGERANGLEIELSGRALRGVEKVGNAGNNVRVES